jgi:hypothetical protein
VCPRIGGRRDRPNSPRTSLVGAEPAEHMLVDHVAHDDEQAVSTAGLFALFRRVSSAVSRRACPRANARGHLGGKHVEIATNWRRTTTVASSASGVVASSQQPSYSS